MESPVWLRNYENVLRMREERERTREAMSVLLLLLLFAGISVVVIYLKYNSIVNWMSYLGWAGGILGLSCFMVMVLSPQSVPKDEAKVVKDNLARLLTTKEEVKEFDRQMRTRPKYSIEVNSESSVEITDSYLVSRYEFCDKLSYRIAKLSEVAGSRLVTPRSCDEGAEQRYVVDLLNADGERLMAIWVDGASKMKELEETLAKACPGLALRDCKAL